MEAREIVRDCQRYSDTVAFFYVFSERLTELGAKVEIEQDRRTPTGARRTPDFIVLDRDTITDVFEHKGSLSAPQHVLTEFNDVANKYRTLLSANGPDQPQVTLLYPAHQESVVDMIRDRLDPLLSLCSFDQSSVETEVSFNLTGRVRSPLADGVLRGAPIGYDPAIVRSTYKYIRADPPVPYVASEVWRILPTFKGVKEADQRIYDVRRNLLLDRLKKFYPGWIRDIQQVNTARVDGALSFLHSAGFVQWQRGSNLIRVNSSRGTRSGDHLETFAREYTKLFERKAAKSIQLVGRGQKILDEFP